MKLLNFIKSNLKELTLLLLPAIICIIVYLTPSSFQNLFVLDLNHLNWFSWFTYIFLHVDFSHIFNNLLIYILAIISAYVLTPKEDRKLFVKIFYILIGLIPLLTLILMIFFRDIGSFPMSLIYNRGFSGISAGALGILCFAISKHFYLEMKQEKSFTRLLYCCYYFFIPTLAMMVINLSIIFSIIIWVIWLLIIAFWFFSKIFYVKKNKVKSNIEKIDIKNLVSPLIIPLIILVYCIQLLVPINVINNGSAVNTPAHLFGFSIAFIFSLIISYYFSKVNK